MYKYSINSDYRDFEEDLLGIRTYFTNSSNSIHKARNELKIVTLQNISVVVKSFKVLNLLRRVFYTFFRDTKAKKSYEYSLKIGKFTPEPIGYIEFYNGNLLYDSYFLAKEFKYDFTIREPLLDKNFPNKEQVFKEFAQFTFELHQNNILHQDYSPGNILIKEDNGSYIFKIVDINRMKFKDLTLDERLKNFDKLWAKDEDLTTIIKEYARISKEDEQTCIDIALKYSYRLKLFKNIKKYVKGRKKDIDW